MDTCEHCGEMVGPLTLCECGMIARMQEERRFADSPTWFADHLTTMGKSVSLSGLVELSKDAARYRFLRDKVAFTSWSGDVKIHYDLPMQLGDSLEDCQRRMDESIDELLANV